MEKPKTSDLLQKIPSVDDQNQIIEEKISKVNGDIAIKRY